MLEMLLNMTNLAFNVFKTIYNVHKIEIVQTSFHIKINLTGDTKGRCDSYHTGQKPHICLGGNWLLFVHELAIFSVKHQIA